MSIYFVFLCSVLGSFFARMKQINIRSLKKYLTKILQYVFALFSPYILQLKIIYSSLTHIKHIIIRQH